MSHPPQTSHAALYDAVWEAAAPTSVLHGQSSIEYCRLLQYPTALLGRLTERFLEPSLVSAGVATYDLENQLTVAAPLAGGDALLVVVRDAKGHATDLVTDRGAVSGRTPTASLLADDGVRNLISACDGLLVITFALVDAVWFWSAGAPAVVCQGVDALTVSFLREIERQLCFWPGGDEDRSPTAPAAPIDQSQAVATSTDSIPTVNGSDGLVRTAPENPLTKENELEGATHGRCGEARAALSDMCALPLQPMIMIAGCSPRNEDTLTPVDLQQRLCELGRVQTALGPNLPQLYCWSPSAEELASIALLRAHGTPETLREALLGSLGESRLLSFLLPDRPELSYPEARRRYRAVAARASADVHDADLSIAQRDLNRAIERDLIEPLIELGIACQNPVDRLLHTAMAEVGGRFHQLAAQAFHEMSRSTTGLQNVTRDFSSLLKSMATIRKLIQ